MTAKKQPKKESFIPFKKFLAQNQEFDLKAANLNDPESLPTLNWKGLSKNREEILTQLPAYQRLLNIVPDRQTDLALALLENNLHSALQIAALPKARFLADYAPLTKDEKLLEACYHNALAIRARLLLHYVNQTQQGSPATTV